MKRDIEFIKTNYSMVIPLNGIITSKFGEREPSQIISANHAGIDIGANEGTKIVSTIDGKVTEVSEEGDYGKHIKIINDKVTTLYAHCNDIFVNIGDKVIKGQEIAEVGKTGKATGPHLHFEIRVENRLVDPGEILQF